MQFPTPNVGPYGEKSQSILNLLSGKKDMTRGSTVHQSRIEKDQSELKAQDFIAGTESCKEITVKTPNNADNSSISTSLRFLTKESYL